MKIRYQVFICISYKPRVFGGGCCNDKGSENLLEELKTLVEEQGLAKQVEINSSSCLRNCLNGPSMLVLPGRITYGKLTKEDLPTIIQEHFIDNKPVKALIKEPSSYLFG